MTGLKLNQIEQQPAGSLLAYDSTGKLVPIAPGAEGSFVKIVGGVITWAASPTRALGTLAGQTEYWNGSAWVLLNPGTPGQVPVSGAGGLPVWSDGSQVAFNYLTLKDSAGTPPALPGYGSMYLNTDHTFHVKDTNNIDYIIPVTPSASTPASNPGGPTVTPPTVSPPPSPTSVYQAGPITFQSSALALADFNSPGSLVVGSEAITNNATAGRAGGPALQILVAAISGNQVVVEKDLTGLKSRSMVIGVSLDTSATITNEHTLVNFYKDGYAKGSTPTNQDVQFRMAPVPGGGAGFIVLLRQAGITTDYTDQTLYCKSNQVFSKGTFYDFEIYKFDGGYGVRFNGKPIIQFYGPDANRFDNTNSYLGPFAVGKYYSSSLVGKIFIDKFIVRQDYVYPTFPTTPAQMCTAAYNGWIARYLRADGAVVRPYPQGKDFYYNASSDIVSEGQGYGMQLAVQFNDQTNFNLMYNYAKNHLFRSVTIGGSPAGAHLQSWHQDDVVSQLNSGVGGILDPNYAADGDIDTIKALIWAHDRWGDGGAINYSTEINNIEADLRTQNCVLDSSNSNEYFAADGRTLPITNPVIINPSYMDITAFKMLKTFTSNTFWDHVVDGSYDTWNKASASVLDKASSDGLTPNWCQYFYSSTHTVGANAGSSTNYSYDGFRVYPRGKMAAIFYPSDTRAVTFLSGSARTFFESQWTANNAIYAEYAHDGTVTGKYENTMMNFSAFWCMTAASSVDVGGVALYSSRQTSLFTQHPFGDFFRDGTTATGKYQGKTSYFNEFWMIINEMMYNGLLVNY